MVFLGGITAIPSGISGLNRFAEVAFRYGNVGRLKPDPVGDYIRIIVDSPGEIGTINQGDAEKVLRYKEIRQVDPVGTFKLSASRNEFKGEIPEMGGVMDVVRQVSRFQKRTPHLDIYQSTPQRDKN